VYIYSVGGKWMVSMLVEDKEVSWKVFDVLGLLAD